MYFHADKRVVVSIKITSETSKGVGSKQSEISMFVSGQFSSEEIAFLYFFIETQYVTVPRSVPKAEVIKLPTGQKLVLTLSYQVMSPYYGVFKVHLNKKLRILIKAQYRVVDTRETSY